MDLPNPFVGLGIIGCRHLVQGVRHSISLCLYAQYQYLFRLLQFVKSQGHLHNIEVYPQFPL